MPESEPTKEELQKRIGELEQQAQARKPAELEFRVSEKGGISVYGLGRFPVTLYYEQWIRLLARADEPRTFIEENKSRNSCGERFFLCSGGNSSSPEDPVQRECDFMKCRCVT